MELKKFVQIFYQERKIFLGMGLGVFALGLAIFYGQPTYYKTSLMLNVTRQGTQKTEDYRFDEFYRLQADERFGDTVVRWLSAPRLKEDICQQVGKGCSHNIKARRLSSQYIEVVYKTKQKEAGYKEAQAIVKVLQEETKRLNKDQKNEDWFTLVANQPLVERGNWKWSKVILLNFLIGLLVGFWSVLIKYYWQKEEKEK